MPALTHQPDWNAHGAVSPRGRGRGRGRSRGRGRWAERSASFLAEGGGSPETLLDSAQPPQESGAEDAGAGPGGPEAEPAAASSQPHPHNPQEDPLGAPLEPLLGDPPQELLEGPHLGLPAPAVDEAVPEAVPEDLGEAGADLEAEPAPLDPQPTQSGFGPLPVSEQMSAQLQQSLPVDTSLMQAPHPGLGPPQMSMQAMLHGPMVQSGYPGDTMMQGSDSDGGLPADFTAPPRSAERPRKGVGEAMNMYIDSSGMQTFPQDMPGPVAESAAPYQVGCLAFDSFELHAFRQGHSCGKHPKCAGLSNISYQCECRGLGENQPGWSASCYLDCNDCIPELCKLTSCRHGGVPHGYWLSMGSEKMRCPEMQVSPSPAQNAQYVCNERLFTNHRLLRVLQLSSTAVWMQMLNVHLHK